jgi:hypothetical protein
MLTSCPWYYSAGCCRRCRATRAGSPCSASRASSSPSPTPVSCPLLLVASACCWLPLLLCLFGVGLSHTRRLLVLAALFGSASLPWSVLTSHPSLLIYRGWRARRRQAEQRRQEPGAFSAAGFLSRFVACCLERTCAWARTLAAVTRGLCL